MVASKWWCSTRPHTRSLALLLQPKHTVFFIHAMVTSQLVFTQPNSLVSWCEIRTVMWEQQYWLSKFCNGLCSVHTCVCSMEWSLKSKYIDIFLVGQSEWRQASTAHSHPPSQETGNNTPFSSQMNVTKFFATLPWGCCMGPLHQLLPGFRLLPVAIKQTPFTSCIIMAKRSITVTFLASLCASLQ